MYVERGELGKRRDKKGGGGKRERGAEETAERAKRRVTKRGAKGNT
jgi:hypothetical protein